jgi:hypothetical protein
MPAKNASIKFLWQFPYATACLPSELPAFNRSGAAGGSASAPQNRLLKLILDSYLSRDCKPSGVEWCKYHWRAHGLQPHRSRQSPVAQQFICGNRKSCYLGQVVGSNRAPSEALGGKAEARGEFLIWNRCNLLKSPISDE